MKRAAVALLLLAACARQAEPSAADHARVRAYGVELAEAEAACVDRAKTIEESRICRADAKARINRKYGRDVP